MAGSTLLGLIPECAHARASFRRISAFPRYSPTGHLLFVDATASLMAASFDVERLELTGAAVPVAERLAVRSKGVGFFVFLGPAKRTVFHG